MQEAQVDEVSVIFGSDSSYIIAEVVSLIFAVLWIWFCFRIICFICKKGKGVEVPLWILIIIFIPIIGVWAAYIHYKARVTKQ